MESEPTQTTSDHSITIKLPRILKRIPKSNWRAAFLLFAFGFGIGAGVLAVKESIQWYRNRPLPPLPDRKWPEFSFPEFGLRAKLSTEWSEPDELKYRLTLMPSEGSDPNDFFNRLSKALKVTLNVYDNRHFIVQHSDEYLSSFTAIIDSNGKNHSVSHQGTLYISRDQYAALSSWNLTVNGMPPINRNTNGGTPAKPTGEHKDAPVTGSGLRGDDVLTGYSVRESSLGTSGGLTFEIYKDAEKGAAISWGVDNARVHYECNPALECTMRRRGSEVVLHARLKK